MANMFTITLTDLELKGLEYVAVDANDWIQNAVHERCRLAIDELVQYEIQSKLSAGLPITGTREEIAMSSNALSAAQRNAEFLTKMNLMYNTEGDNNGEPPPPIEPPTI
jgi:hypothetical protein